MELIVLKLESAIWGLPIICVLIFTHIYFTFKLKFPQKHIFKGLNYLFVGDKKNSKEGISSYKSLMTVLAGTLGTGNIVGISAAIVIGGIGSIFWLFISGVFAIATKYAETYLVLKYRNISSKGNFGGSMYVLKNRIDNKCLAILFSIFVIIASFGIGCMLQSNAFSTAVLETFNINEYLLGIIVTIICSYVIFSDEKRISNVSSILIPVASIIYIFMCIGLLYVYRANLLNSVLEIIRVAFDFKSVAGGMVGSMAIKAMSEGLSKGLFSNEAGLGSSPMFDCTVREKDIKKQSIISSTSVFIDTVVLCTLTGIIIVASGLYNQISSPMGLVQEVFSGIPYGKYLLTFSISAFAIAAIPCWSYFGTISVKFLFADKKIYQFIYKTIYAFCIFLGAVSTMRIVWSISNIANALMVIPNLYMIYYLRNEIKG